MSGGFNVEASALRTYAKQGADAAAGRIDAIRARTHQLALTQQAFGRLPQSDELKADYDTQRKESRDDLYDAVETLYAIVDALRESADAYRTTEKKNSGGLDGGS